MPAYLPVKRSYHPLVVYFFYIGALDETYCSQIPYTTLHHWKSVNHNELFGFEWVSEFADQLKDIEKVRKRKLIFKSAIICCRIINTFTSIHKNLRGYKTTLRKNSKLVIGAIDRLLTDIPLQKACKIFGITTNKYYRWKNNLHCSVSVLNLCFKSHPLQLSVSETITIEKEVNSPGNFFKPLSSLHFELMRKGDLFVSLSTFYKYTAKLLMQEKKTIESKTFKGFRASRVFEYLHIDTTFILTEKSGKLRVVFVKDNFSKALLHKAIVPNGKSEFIRDILAETVTLYNLPHSTHPITIISDGGAENQGKVTDWIANMPTSYVCKLTAKTSEFEYSNSMVESIFHIFKNEFLKRRKVKIGDYSDLWEQITLFDEYYNYNRFPIELHGLAPMEVVNGSVPDKTRFRDSFILSKQQRLLENKSRSRCGFCK